MLSLMKLFHSDLTTCGRFPHDESVMFLTEHILDVENPSNLHHRETHFAKDILNTSISVIEK